MSQYDLLHRIALFRDRVPPPDSAIRSSGGRTSPLTDAETSRVRRALFGPVDHAENLRFVQQELARGQREAEKKWNYDFVNDCPVNVPESRYVWESMDASSRRGTHQVHALESRDAEGSSGTVGKAKEEAEYIQSERGSSLVNIDSEKSEKRHDAMSETEKILPPPEPLVLPPSAKPKSHPSSSVDNFSKSLVSISAPATACATPHESPQAGSSKGSQILPANNREKGNVCDKTKSAPADSILSAAASCLSTPSKQPSKSNTPDQRSRSKSLHGTQKPITGFGFRERKRSKSKTKIDSRSLKLQEQIAPGQMSKSKFPTAGSEGKVTPRARSRSPTSSSYIKKPDK